MTEKQTYWLRDAEGYYAQVTGAAERDRWVPLGWEPVDGEPEAGFVHVWHPDIAQPGSVPIETIPELWGPLGWAVGPPPGAEHPAAVAAAAGEETDPLAPAPAKTTRKSGAAGTNSKE